MNDQFLQGRLTFLGILISLFGFIAGKVGWVFPQSEADTIAGWIAANWDSLAEFIGMLTAFYGRLRMNWRE